MNNEALQAIRDAVKRCYNSIYANFTTSKSDRLEFIIRQHHMDTLAFIPNNNDMRCASAEDYIDTIVKYADEYIAKGIEENIKEQLNAFLLSVAASKTDIDRERIFAQESSWD